MAKAGKIRNAKTSFSTETLGPTTQAVDSLQKPSHGPQATMLQLPADYIIGAMYRHTNKPPDKLNKMKIHVKRPKILLAGMWSRFPFLYCHQHL